tara:strand:+ start:326 stop:664 length:339 start_codon:yes stop_codon:yes gene_type:complete
MQTQLTTEQIEINGINEKMFINFFNIDDDFQEVAEKYSKEVFNLFCDKFYQDEYISVLNEALQHCINMKVLLPLELTNFILKSSICIDYDTTLICTNEEENIYTCVISYMTN